MVLKYFDCIKAYAAHLQNQTGTPVIIAPSEVSSERFHVELTLLPHPVIPGNGTVRLRLRATVFAEIPPSETAINDCIERSVRLALFFDHAESFPVKKAEAGQRGVYCMSYPSEMRADDDLFSDLEGDNRSYSYNESWLVELESRLYEIANE